MKTGRRNLTSGFAPDEVRDRSADTYGEIDGAGILCPRCLVERIEKSLGRYTTWKIEPERELASLAHVAARHLPGAGGRAVTTKMQGLRIRTQGEKTTSVVHKNIPS